MFYAVKIVFASNEQEKQLLCTMSLSKKDGARTLSITTFIKMTFSKTTLRIMTFSIITLSIMAFRILLNQAPHSAQ